jgi:hypothetical protein
MDSMGVSTALSTVNDCDTELMPGSALSVGDFNNRRIVEELT